MWLLQLAVAQIIAPTELRSGAVTFVSLGPAETRTWHLANASGAEVAALIPTEESTLYSVVVPDTAAPGEYYFAVKPEAGEKKTDDTQWRVQVTGPQSRLIIETDKGLYKPGQTVLMRVLALTYVFF